jgi:hypothetical protein
VTPAPLAGRLVTARVAPEGRAVLGAMVQEGFSEWDIAHFKKPSALEQIKVAVLVREGLACSLVDALPDVWAFEKGRGSDGQNP